MSHVVMESELVPTGDQLPHHTFEGEVEDDNNIIPLTPIPLSSSRYHFVDFLRGIAISIMLQANIVPYIDKTLTPLYLRMIYSLAAPTFIFLSGISATKFSSSNRNTTIYFPFSVQRVLFSGIFVDIIAWFLYPFQTFDVLYIISLNIFTIHHARSYDLSWSIILWFLLFILWIIYLFIGSYRFHITSLSIFEIQPFDDYLLNCICHFFFDGWFPFFPWILIGWLGYFQVKIQYLNTIWYKILILFIFLITTLIYLLFAPTYGSSNTSGTSMIGSLYNHEDREGYEELFYPVTLLYFFWSYSTVLVMYYLLEYCESFIEKYQQYNPLCLIGRNSLLVYITHCLFISYIIIIAKWPNIAIKENVFCYFYLYFYILIIVYMKEYLIHDPKKLPTIIRFITGI